MATEIIPRYSDFTVRFKEITLDEGVLDFATVSGWFFSLGQDINGAPLIAKNSINNPSDFTVDPIGYNVGVFITSTGLRSSGGIDGLYYAALWANISGRYAGNLQTTFTIQPQIGRV